MFDFEGVKEKLTGVADGSDIEFAGYTDVAGQAALRLFLMQKSGVNKTRRAFEGLLHKDVLTHRQLVAGQLKIFRAEITRPIFGS